MFSRRSEMPVRNIDNTILGLGNKALSDDAIGIKVTRYLLKNYPNLNTLHIIDGSNLSYELTTVLENTQNLIVIYAATLNQSPGTISTFVGTDMDRILKRTQRNANETALADMFEIAKLAKKLPPNRALITIEPKKISWGNRLSACVNKAIPQLSEIALTLMNQWTGASFDEPATAKNPIPSSNQHADP